MQFHIKNETLFPILIGAGCLALGLMFGWAAGVNAGVDRMQRQAVNRGLAHFSTHVLLTTNWSTNVVTNVTQQVKAREYTKFNWNYENERHTQQDATEGVEGTNKVLRR